MKTRYLLSTILSVGFIACSVHAEETIAEETIPPIKLKSFDNIPVNAQSTQNPDTTLAISLLAQVYPDSLGGESIAVFRDVQNSSNPRKRYYVLPYFKINNLEEFAAQVTTECNDRSENENVIVPLQFEIASRDVNNEIVNLLNNELGLAESGSPVKLGQLQPYPFGSFMIVAGAETDSAETPAEILFSYPVVPRTILGGVISSRAVSFPTQLSERKVQIKESCDLLTRAIETNDIAAYVLTPFDRTSVSSFSVNYRAFWNSGSFQDILINSKQTGSVSTTSKTYGASLNLNLVDLGATGDSSQTEVVNTDTRHRVVSGDVIERAASQFLEVAYFDSYTRSADEGTIGAHPSKVAWTTDHLDQMVKMIKDQTETVTAEVRNWGTENASLFADVIGEYALDQQTVNRVLNAANNIKIERQDNTTTSGSYAGAEGETNRNANNKYHTDRGITWTDKGEGWVPVSVDLQRLSEQTAKGLARLGASNVEAITSTDLQLLMLPKIYREGVAPLTKPNLPEVQPAKYVKLVPERTVSSARYDVRIERYYDTPLAILEGPQFNIQCTTPPALPSDFILIGGTDLKYRVRGELGGRQYNGLKVKSNKTILKDYVSRQVSAAFEGMDIQMDGHCLQEPVCISSKPSASGGEGICISQYVEETCMVNEAWLNWYEHVFKPSGRSAPEGYAECTPGKIPLDRG